METLGESKPLRLLFVGAGGVGAYYAARLIGGGNSVLLMARGSHLEALRQDGLRVEHNHFSFQEPVCAVDEVTLQSDYRCGDFDAVVLTLKSQDTANWLGSTSAWLDSASTPILSLQNGVENEGVLANLLGAQRVVGGLAVRIGAHIVSPGCVKAQGLGQIVLGAWPNSVVNGGLQGLVKRLADAFNASGIPTRAVANIRHELWKKLLVNNGVNPLSALTRRDTGFLTKHPHYRQVIYAAMQEVAAVSSADDVVLSQSDVDEMFKLICEFDPIKTSMLVDLEKGRPLELDAISGSVLRRAERLGIDTPVTALIHSMLSS
ncbi:MAG: 2-dehydropantoate 2-reductase [Limnobacter sp. CACIAM 66H1]|jgi:2-dehydropantoate 2-reductase|uniref:ketopantoate reductase family protein n=1 Tax=unclassified Limnobacter TaxID=2630203 RepID=UPI0007A90901|nr:MULTISPECIES: 2-dehydropantoate 2-reductase [unclassified Limnobacter]KYP10930.1 MAG: 2-dehydropantoate 2-reductase [Limnobacter sp. CACIAM 66H1]MDP3271248.1 2-dehydropantoate 2-reductase [Limnobacter sp.]